MQSTKCVFSHQFYCININIWPYVNNYFHQTVLALQNIHFNYMFLCNILNSSSGVYNNRSALTQEWTYVYSSKTSKYVGSSVRAGVNADLLL